MSENSKREELKKLKIIKRMEELREKGFSEEKIKRFIELDRLYEERIKGDLLLKRITKKRNKKYQLENKEVLKEKRRTKRLNEKSLSSEEKIIESLKVKQKFQSIENPLLDFELSQWICSECEKLNKSRPFNKKPVYQKDSFICSKCGKEKYFLTDVLK